MTRISLSEEEKGNRKILQKIARDVADRKNLDSDSAEFIQRGSEDEDRKDVYDLFIGSPPTEYDVVEIKKLPSGRYEGYSLRGEQRC